MIRYDMIYLLLFAFCLDPHAPMKQDPPVQISPVLLSNVQAAKSVASELGAQRLEFTEVSFLAFLRPDITVHRVLADVVPPCKTCPELFPSKSCAVFAHRV